MAAPGATFPSHLQPHRRTETHQQRLLEAQADLLAAKHPVHNNGSNNGGGGPMAKPAGLYNEGNTCFFNSTFQALAATTSLIDLIGPVIFPAPPSGSTQSGASTSTSTSTSTPTTTHNIPDALDHPAKTYTTTATGSDNAPLYPHSIPSLLDAALEPENARLLPVTLAFEKCLGKAWRAKDEGLKGSISASSPSASSSGKEMGKREANAEKEKSVSLKALLRELGKKYDQYEDYRQQDAHELLRHLLDSISMEEKDLIKVLHPPPPKTPGSHKRISSLRQARNHALVGEEGDGMIPFADALFGGSLVSVVICQGCKSVSHTYEGFMDISLSIGNQQPKVRKRDRIKAVASKFKLGSHKSSVPPAAPSSGSANDFNAANNVYLEGVYEPVFSSGLTDHHESTADEEGGNHHHAAQHRVGGRKESVTSMAVSTTSIASDATSGPTVAGFFGNKNKRDSVDGGLKKRSSLTAWTTGKKRSSRPSTASSFDSSNEIAAENKLASHGGNAQSTLWQKTSGISNTYMFSGFRSNETTPTSSRRNSQVGLTLDHSAVVERIEEEDHTIPPKPRPEQAAYIRRLLNGPNLPPRAIDDPLERLRNGMAQMPISPGTAGGLSGGDANHAIETTPTANHQPTIEGLETDLMDSLRNFTAVEVLEGDNAFACHKCWRYKTGRGGRRRRELARLANMAQAPAAGETSSSSDSEDGVATPAKRNSIAFTDPRKIPEIAVTTDDEPADTSITTNETSVSNGSLTANRSARPSSTSSVEADRLTVVSSASGRSNSGTSGYQTSSEDSSDEAPVGRLSVVRPPPPQRRKSQHFVLQRAFKRYMIARAPPVLVFHFKRFQQSSKQAASNMYSGSFAALKKIDDFVSFPERIDLSPFLAPNRQDYKIVIGEDGVGRANYHSHPAGDTGPELVPMRYRLYAVVVHLGLTAISGHYVCYVLVDPGMIIKTRATSSVETEPAEVQDVTCEPDMAAVAIADPSDGTSASPHPVDNRVWCYCSDTQVRLASLEEVLKAKAYMCFYEKST